MQNWPGFRHRLLIVPLLGDLSWRGQTALWLTAISIVLRDHHHPFQRQWKLSGRILHLNRFCKNGFQSCLRQTRSPTSSSQLFAFIWYFLNVFFSFALRNSSQESRPALSNSMQRPQLGQSVSLPLEMGTAQLPSRSGGAQLLLPCLSCWFCPPVK